LRNIVLAPLKSGFRCMLEIWWRSGFSKIWLECNQLLNLHRRYHLCLVSDFVCHHSRSHYRLWHHVFGMDDFLQGFWLSQARSVYLFRWFLLQPLFPMEYMFYLMFRSKYLMLRINFGTGQSNHGRSSNSRRPLQIFEKSSPCEWGRCRSRGRWCRWNRTCNRKSFVCFQESPCIYLTYWEYIYRSTAHHLANRLHHLQALASRARAPQNCVQNIDLWEYHLIL